MVFWNRLAVDKSYLPWKYIHFQHFAKEMCLVLDTKQLVTKAFQLSQTGNVLFCSGKGLKFLADKKCKLKTLLRLRFDSCYIVWTFLYNIKYFPKCLSVRGIKFIWIKRGDAVPNIFRSIQQIWHPKCGNKV